MKFWQQKSEKKSQEPLSASMADIKLSEKVIGMQGLRNLSLSADFVDSNQNKSFDIRHSLQNEIKNKLSKISTSLHEIDNMDEDYGISVTTPSPIVSSKSASHTKLNYAQKDKNYVYPPTQSVISNASQTSESSSLESSSISTWDSGINYELHQINSGADSIDSLLEISIGNMPKLSSTTASNNIFALRNDAAYHKISLKQRNRRSPRNKKPRHLIPNILNDFDLPSMPEVNADFEQLEEKMIVTRQKENLSKLEREGKFSCNTLGKPLEIFSIIDHNNFNTTASLVNNEQLLSPVIFVSEPSPSTNKSRADKLLPQHNQQVSHQIIEEMMLSFKKRSSKTTNRDDDTVDHGAFEDCSSPSSPLPDHRRRVTGTANASAPETPRSPAAGGSSFSFASLFRFNHNKKKIMAPRPSGIPVAATSSSSSFPLDHHQFSGKGRYHGHNKAVLTPPPTRQLILPSTTVTATLGTYQNVTSSTTLYSQFGTACATVTKTSSSPFAKKPLLAPTIFKRFDFFCRSSVAAKDFGLAASSSPRSTTTRSRVKGDKDYLLSTGDVFTAASHDQQRPMLPPIMARFQAARRAPPAQTSAAAKHAFYSSSTDVVVASSSPVNQFFMRHDDNHLLPQIRRQSCHSTTQLLEKGASEDGTGDRTAAFLYSSAAISMSSSAHTVARETIKTQPKTSGPPSRRNFFLLGRSPFHHHHHKDTYHHHQNQRQIRDDLKTTLNNSTEGSVVSPFSPAGSTTLLCTPSSSSSVTMPDVDIATVTVSPTRTTTTWSGSAAHERPTPSPPTLFNKLRCSLRKRVTPPAVATTNSSSVVILPSEEENSCQLFSRYTHRCCNENDDDTTGCDDYPLPLLHDGTHEIFPSLQATSFLPITSTTNYNRPSHLLQQHTRNNEKYYFKGEELDDGNDVTVTVIPPHLHSPIKLLSTASCDEHDTAREDITTISPSPIVSFPSAEHFSITLPHHPNQPTGAADYIKYDDFFDSRPPAAVNILHSDEDPMESCDMAAGGEEGPNRDFSLFGLGFGGDLDEYIRNYGLEEEHRRQGLRPPLLLTSLLPTVEAANNHIISSTKTEALDRPISPITTLATTATPISNITHSNYQSNYGGLGVNNQVNEKGHASFLSHDNFEPIYVPGSAPKHVDDLPNNLSHKKTVVISPQSQQPPSPSSLAAVVGDTTPPLPLKECLAFRPVSLTNTAMSVENSHESNEDGGGVTAIKFRPGIKNYTDVLCYSKKLSPTIAERSSLFLGRGDDDNEPANGHDVTTSHDHYETLKNGFSNIIEDDDDKRHMLDYDRSPINGSLHPVVPAVRVQVGNGVKKEKKTNTRRPVSCILVAASTGQDTDIDPKEEHIHATDNPRDCDPKYNLLLLARSKCNTDRLHDRPRSSPTLLRNSLNTYKMVAEINGSAGINIAQGEEGLVVPIYTPHPSTITTTTVSKDECCNADNISPLLSKEDEITETTGKPIPPLRKGKVKDMINTFQNLGACRRNEI